MNKDHFPAQRFLFWLFCLLLLLMAPAPVAAQTQTSDDATHTVRYGETLSEIAQAYNVAMADLMAWNGLTDPDAIYVGQILVVPPTDEPVSSVAQSTDGAQSTDAVQPTGSSAPANDVLPEKNASPETAASTEAETALVHRAFASLNPTYTVQTGDTLGWIALRYGVDLAALKALNRLDNGARIAVGQRLLLPATQDELQVTTPTRTHQVAPGEFLGLIAQKYGVSLSDLMAVNGIRNPDAIYVGQQLTIPGFVATEQAPSVGPARSGFYYHRVQPGETLSHLAKRFDSTPQAIVKYNDLPDEATVFSGLEVRIPFGPPTLSQRRPPTPYSGSRFLISLSRQRCWVYQGDRIAYEWKCSTGQGQWVTRTGTFPVKTKMEMAESSAYRLDMPYWLGLYDVGEFENGIHGLPIEWDTGQKLWDTLVGQPATFGCAMLMDEDAATLFELAYVGMPVQIVD